MRALLLFVFLIIGSSAARCQLSASSDWFLNSTELSTTQFNERAGLSQSIFNQNMAQQGLGNRDAIVKTGHARIQAGKATVTYHPLSPTLASLFAASRSREAAKQRELTGVYNQYLQRFRDAQREMNLGERDVAASLALAFTSYYEIYSQGKQASAAQTRDAKQQFRQSLLQNSYFQGTNDRYRQMLDENTAVQAVASLVLYRNAAKRGDTKAVETERQRALAFLDFYWPGGEERAQKIRLTSAGFRD